MNLRSRIVSCILTISALVMVAYPASAQNANPGLTIVPSSSTPIPGQSITLTAQSYSFDVNGSSITWTSNGKVIGRGAGLTTVTVTAPALGKTLSISVAAITPDGTENDASLSITSASVDLIIEPDGYVPPLFPGKIPAVYQNSVKIVAVPHLANSRGVEYPPSSLVYKWEQGSSVLQDASGYGKDSVVIQGPVIPRAQTVRVTVSTRDGSMTGSAMASVDFSAPTVVFYRNDPLYGPMYDSAISDTLYISSQREAGIIAVPYGFDIPSSGPSGLDSSWSINGTSHSELADMDTVTLRAPDGQSGTSNVDFTVSNKTDFLQRASGGFTVQFDSGSTSQ